MPVNHMLAFIAFMLCSPFTRPHAYVHICTRMCAGHAHTVLGQNAHCSSMLSKWELRQRLTPTHSHTGLKKTRSTEWHLRNYYVLLDQQKWSANTNLYPWGKSNQLGAVAVTTEGRVGELGKGKKGERIRIEVGHRNDWVHLYVDWQVDRFKKKKKPGGCMFVSKCVKTLPVFYYTIKEHILRAMRGVL